MGRITIHLAVIRGICYLERDFFSSLQKEVQRKLLGRLKDYATYTYEELMRDQKLKKLKGHDRVWEIRVQVQGDAFRLFGRFLGSELHLVDARIKKGNLSAHDLGVIEKKIHNLL